MCVYAAKLTLRLLTFASPQILAISALPSLFPVSVVLIVSLSFCHRRIPRIHLVHLVVHPVRTECHIEGDWHGWLIGSFMRVCFGISGLGLRRRRDSYTYCLSGNNYKYIVVAFMQ